MFDILVTPLLPFFSLKVRKKKSMRSKNPVKTPIKNYYTIPLYSKYIAYMSGEPGNKSSVPFSNKMTISSYLGVLAGFLV
jgi:hypothetical protein